MLTILDRIESRSLVPGDSTQFILYNDSPDQRRLLTLAELRRTSLQIAAGLPRSGPVFVLESDPLAFATSFFGCLYAGAIAVPIAMPSRRRGLDTLREQMSMLGARHCLTDRETIDRLQRWFGEDLTNFGIEWIDRGEIVADAIGDPFEPVMPSASDVAFLQLTSGSTGAQKAVAITHENIIANSRIIQDCFQNTPESTSVSWLPHYHDMGLVDGIVQPVYSGFPAVLVTPASFLQKPVRWLRAMSEFKATYSGGPNFAFDFCVERIQDSDLADLDLSALRSLYNGSEKVRDATLERFVKKFDSIGVTKSKFISCYGLAEATLAVSATKIDEEPTKLLLKKEELSTGRVRLAESDREEVVEFLSSGVPMGGTKVHIDEAASAGEIGEVCIAGPSVTRGYWNTEDPGDRALVIEGERFLRTGDLGFLYEGELFVVGRIKDIVIVRGRNHDPAEIEKTSHASHTYLRPNGAAAFSAEVGNTEQLIVVQEIRRECLRQTDLANVVDAIVASVAEVHGVAPYDVQLISPGTLPRTTSGKIQRRKCFELWNANHFEPLALLQRSIQQHA